MNTKTHGGKREGSGRKSSPFPEFSKKLRATIEERAQFSKLLTGDARKDFEIIFNLLRKGKTS